jgi:hypothetical protein
MENRLALSPTPVGYTPDQIRAAYGLPSISDLSSLPSWCSGAGQRIAIIEIGSDAHLDSDLDAFDRQFNLYEAFGPASLFLTEDNPGDAGSLGTADEIALDVEWAHAIAPGAHILVVDANAPPASDPNFENDAAASFFGAVKCATAQTQHPVSVVSMSYGWPEFLLSGGGANYNSDFAAPGVTFVAGSGDTGIYPDYRNNDDMRIGVDYPAASPNVLAVGGTTLLQYPDGSYGEVGWSLGSDRNLGLPGLGSGGGFSSDESEPLYQRGAQESGSRTTPDVSFDADPNSGVALYDSIDNTTDGPWAGSPPGTPPGTITTLRGNGTSLAAPCWAALIAIVDAGLAAGGHPTLDGSTQTSPALYRLPSADFHEIASGNNGYPAGGRYNLVTGLGSPVANRLIPDLINTFLVTVHGIAFAPTAEMSFSGPVASFDIKDPARVLRDYTATINWGDGTTTNGTLQADPAGGYEVVGTHSYSYAPAGTTYQVTITLADGTGYRTTGTTTAVILSSDLVYGHGRRIRTTAGQPFNGVVATFSGYGPFDGVGDYSAVIDWGDGNYTRGIIVKDPSGGFMVEGTKTFRKPGAHRVWVTITGGSGAFVPDVVRVSARRPRVIQPIRQRSGGHGPREMLDGRRAEDPSKRDSIVAGSAGDEPR